MKASYTALAAALVGCGALTAPVCAQSAPDFKFSGFGTLGAVHSSEKNADYVSTIFQPSGAGYTRGTSFDPDSKLGGQVAVRFNDQLSAVVQVVSQHQYDNSYTPMFEWANVKYQITPEVGVRLGRIAAPSYLLSESRFVGYSYPWVRPPIEAYGVLAITSNDGVDATWRHQFGAANNTLQGYYGNSSPKIPGGKVKSNPGWGLNDSVEFGSWTLRAGYTSITLDLDVPSLNGLVDGLQQFAAGAGAVPVPAFQSAAAQALALADKYKLTGMDISAVAVGASYDPGNWFAMGEFVDFSGDGVLSDSRSWYLSAGYRFGSFTPYVSYASTKADIRNEPGISTVGAPPLADGANALNAGINTTLNSVSGSQTSAAVGVRWDFMRNVALKAQYDRVDLGDNSKGRLVNTQPAFTPGASFNLYSLAVDFVF